MKTLIEQYIKRVNNLKASLVAMDSSSKVYIDTLKEINSLEESIDSYRLNL